VCFLAGAFTTAHAVNRYWDDEAVDYSYTNPTNWSGNVMPSGSDFVFMEGAGDAVTLLSGGTNVTAGAFNLRNAHVFTNDNANGTFSVVNNINMGRGTLVDSNNVATIVHLAGTISGQLLDLSGNATGNKSFYEISGGNLELGSGINLGGFYDSTFSVVGNVATVTVASVIAQDTGDFKFTMGADGVTAIDASGNMAITSGAELIVDGSAYTGGTNTIPLFSYASRTDKTRFAESLSGFDGLTPYVTYSDTEINLMIAADGFDVPPVADGQSLTVFPAPETTDITLTGFDNEGSTLTYAIVVYPTNGTLNVDSLPNVIYIPTDGYQGADSFTFTVFDGNTVSDPATVSITVLNVAPVAISQDVTLFPGSSMVFTLEGTDADNGPSSLTYTVDDSTLSVPLVGATNVWIYTPASDYQGEESFTFTVFDGQATSEVATVSITVTNEVPSADSFGVATLELTSVDFALSGADPEGSNLTYQITLMPQNGSIVTNGTLPNLTYTPDAGTVSDTLEYTVSDGLATSAAATVSITVTSGDLKTLEYDFENTNNISGTTTGIVYTAADVNTFGDGVTVSVLEMDEVGDVEQWGRVDTPQGGDSAEATLADRGVPHYILFTMSVDDSVVVDLSTISFDTSFNNRVNPTDFDWTFSTVVGGVTNDVTAGGWSTAKNTYSTESSGDIVLAGLTDLTDTSVTFIWALNGSRNNTWAKLTMGVDDIVLSGTVNDAGIPPISVSVADGSLVMTWEGSGTYNVLTNTYLPDPNGWGVAKTNAASPVSITIGSAPAVFYKLSK
jgi:hypothetical protein